MIDRSLLWEYYKKVGLIFLDSNYKIESLEEQLRRLKNNTYLQRELDSQVKITKEDLLYLEDINSTYQFFRNNLDLLQQHFGKDELDNIYEIIVLEEGVNINFGIFCKMDEILQVLNQEPVIDRNL